MDPQDRRENHLQLASQGSPGILNDGEPALDMAEQDDGSVLAVSTGTAIRSAGRAAMKVAGHAVYQWLAGRSTGLFT